jgi:glutathione-regulated potassium-efflux system ancillary protein KefG
MRWLPPYAVLGVHRGLSQEALIQHASDFRRTLEALQNNRLDLARVAEQELFNNDLANLLGEE